MQNKHPSIDSVLYSMSHSLHATNTASAAYSRKASWISLCEPHCLWGQQRPNKSSNPNSQPKWSLEMMIGFPKLHLLFQRCRSPVRFGPVFFFPLNSVIATATTADPDALCFPLLWISRRKLDAPIDSIKNPGFPRSVVYYSQLP